MVYDQVPPKVVYDIRADERARLQALLEALAAWGIYWSDKTGGRILALNNEARE